MNMSYRTMWSKKNAPGGFWPQAYKLSRAGRQGAFSPLTPEPDARARGCAVELR